ncbi:MAG: 50S ribosomal protein L29 [Roseibacillus sp.]|nr:50S ribosomal protein L29 [Roseibacillus sp.]
MIMAQSPIIEIRELSSEELQVRLRDLKQEGLNLRLQQATGQLENSARLQLVRREAARVMTVLNERRQSAAASQ